MQSPTAAPREHLTAAQVTDLLHASALTVDFGAELLDLNLSYIDDISDDLVGGTVARNNNATVHGTCDLSISRALTWGVDLVKPYMVLSDGTVEARWNMGVYLLTTPDRQVGETPETYEVQGYDRLHLLQREVGADYSVAAGTTYRAALTQAFTDAGLTGVYVEGSAADSTLPAAKSWPLVAKDQADPDQTDTPVTWLRIVNDLCMAINFRAVWADADGIFRCEAYRNPATRGIEWTFDADDEHLTIVSENRVVSEDVWSTPNRWVFRRTNGGGGVEGDGIYTVNNVNDGPTSQTARGLTWTSVVDYEAASQATLVSLGDRRVADDRRVTTKIELRTGPFPGAGHNDIFSLVDSQIGNRKVQARSWRMPLDGGDVEWEWEVVT